MEITTDRSVVSGKYCTLHHKVLEYDIVHSVVTYLVTTLNHRVALLPYTRAFQNEA